MQRIKEVHENGYYVFTGRSNANSCFIERLSHAKQFLTYANYFLKNYMKIHDYVINRDGWMLIVKINSKRLIQKELTDKENELWRVISERMRLFLSTFVRVTNRSRGRTGCLVHSGYERYFFDNLGEAKKLINKIRTQQVKLYNGRKKYRGLKTHYKISGNIGKGSIFLCSKDRKKGDKMRSNVVKVFDFIRLKDSVLQKLVESTIKYQKKKTANQKE